MSGYPTLDHLVKERLKRWPQKPPGVRQRQDQAAWLRGRPSDDAGIINPYLKLPGSTRLRTLPDGLWLNFGGTIYDPFVDIFAIEACATITNLLDKRSRFAPSTHSLLAVCPMEWLLAPVSREDPTPRWKVTGLLARQPTMPLSLPVREIRVLYGLKSDHYLGFVRHQMPHAHEYYIPMDALTRENNDQDPAILAFLERASISANIFDAPA